MSLMADICLYKVRHPSKHSDQAEEKQQPGELQREAESESGEFQAEQELQRDPDRAELRVPAWRWRLCWSVQEGHHQAGPVKAGPEAQQETELAGRDGGGEIALPGQLQHLRLQQPLAGPPVQGVQPATEQDSIPR